ncbi:type I polyketide synthase [Nocardia lijiangensis]|uniref:type I polyketide synthase n=1 Tax=Nocardia lijiangensis TaxID=299618 RepID=UPI0008341474|nr:type I polyketide synthase [Nocardia lijiangensis]
MTDHSLLADLRFVTAKLVAAQEKLDRASEPIAIVGTGCRFPGGIAGPDDLWEFVAAGGDAIAGFPTDRGWNVDSLYDPDPDTPGKSYVLQGGFLDAIGFDAEFFGISPREAFAMDPQQRLLLEVTWEALEDAGIDPVSLRGSDTGVFAGAFAQHYGSDNQDTEGYRLTGNSVSVISGRIAYVFGLQGPALSIDTACSSSLVAVHQAATALRAGECDLALATGATVMSSPELYIEFARQRALAPDGRCKPFSDDADGTVFGEGAGVLVLERLSDAVRNRRHIHALVCGSAVNQDGASNGLSSPNGPAQQRVIRRALSNAGLTVDDIDVVEAHGTGTRLGDPIEANALLATYGLRRPDTAPLRLGTVKSNLGHTAAAAGMAGIIKMIQSMRHGTLPKSLRIGTPSSHVAWGNGRIELLTENIPWPATGGPRRAAVSGFGISGTNAHVILEQAPPAEDATESDSGAGYPAALLISAHTRQALTAQASRLLAHMHARPDLRPIDVSWSLLNRARYPHRAIVVGADGEQLCAGLRAVVDSTPAAGVVAGEVARPGKTVFVFPGQGGQWLGMARDLLETSPAFVDAITECARVFAPHVDWSLLEVLRSGMDDNEVAPSWLHRVDIVQPTLFAVMVGLAAWWRSLGVVPDAVVGHSQGEVAAAYLAGAITLQDAALIAITRSRLVHDELAGRGGMAAVALSLSEVAERLESYGDTLEVAAVNGPRSIIIAGDGTAIDDFVGRCDADGVRASIIAVDYASHSRHVESLRGQLIAALAGIEPTSAGIPFYSTVTGALLDTAGLDADYWYRNLRGTVRFEECVRALLDDGHIVFLEISPHPLLTFSVEESVCGEQAATVVGSLRRGEDGIMSLLTAAARLDLAGLSIDWATLLAGHDPRRIPLPTYAFQHQRYWATPTRESDPRSMGLDTVDHPLLATLLPAPQSGALTATAAISVQTQPWLADHVVGGSILFPGTGFVELAIRIGNEVQCPIVRELTLLAPLVLSQEGAIPLHILLSEADEQGERDIAFYSRTSEFAAQPQWQIHAKGQLSPHVGARSDAQSAFADAWPPQGSVAVDVDELFDVLRSHGYGHGPIFQGLTSLWRHGDELIAEAALPCSSSRASEYGLHPALLDTLLQASIAGAGLTAVDDGALVLPFAWQNVALHQYGAEQVRARITPAGSNSVTVHVFDRVGVPVMTVESLTSRPIRLDQLRPSALHGRLHVIDWPMIPNPASLPTIELGAWVDMPGSSDAEAAQVVVLDCRGDGGESMISHTHSMVQHALAALRSWSQQQRFESSRLLVLTRNAVAISAGEIVTPAAAAVWGLVRSAQSENPGRILIVDTDSMDKGVHGDVEDFVAVRNIAATAIAGDEPQLAIREGVLHVPRLAATQYEPARTGETPSITAAARGTILVTGGTSGLGATLAEHLVRRHGVGSLLLASRSGPDNPAAQDLCRRLAELDADVEVVACDVSDRAALAALLAGIPEDKPLTGVIHAAAVLDDSVIENMSPAQLTSVLAPKADAAWHLHELTRDHDLALFILYSSVAGIIGSPGQANYAAANAFLDGLAAYRHTLGLPATSIAWGLWEDSTSMTEHVLSTRTHATRMARLGIGILGTDVGLALFDAALEQGLPCVAASTWDTSHLSGPHQDPPPVFRNLIARPNRSRSSRRTTVHSLAKELVGVPETERRDLVSAAVRAHISATLGHGNPDSINLDLTFKELGFDSLTAVEVRNRLNKTTGIAFPATLVFDYPTPAALSDHICERLASQPETEDAAEQNEVRPQLVPAVTAAADPSETIVGIFRRALASKNAVAGFEFLRAAAELRPTFTRTDVADAALPSSVGINGGVPFNSAGTAMPHVVLINTPAFLGGYVQYLSIAAYLGSHRRVSAIPLSGYNPDEPLPETLDAALEGLVEAVMETVGDDEFVIGGLSAGGNLAHAVAGRLLERGNTQLKGLVVLDAFISPEANASISEGLVGHLVEMDEVIPDLAGFTAARLTAIAKWSGLMAQLTFPPVACETLYVKCTKPSSITNSLNAFPVEVWSTAQIVEVVDTDHGSLVGADAELTAQVLEQWLTRGSGL